MKKLWSFLNNVIAQDGTYVPYSWHAPLIEAHEAPVASRAASQSKIRADQSHRAAPRAAWV